MSHWDWKDWTAGIIGVVAYILWMIWITKSVHVGPIFPRPQKREARKRKASEPR